MKSRKKRKSKKAMKRDICIIGMSIVLVVAILFALYLFLHEKDIDVKKDNYKNKEEQMQAETVSFPVVLDDGNIEIESLFQFSGVNPDAEKGEATDIAAIILRNKTETYLTKATVNVVLESGEERTFVVTDLPSKKSAMAFDTDNKTFLDTDICKEISVETTFDEGQETELVDVTVNGLTITVKNITTEDLNEIDVYYRDVFDDHYFGGMTYMKTINGLSAGETATITIEESLLGIIEVVRIVENP